MTSTNDPRYSEEIYDDEALREVCDDLLAEDGVEPTAESRRPLLETLGMLPYELDEVAPGAHVREALMAEIAASRSAEPVASPAGASVHRFEDRRAAPVLAQGGAPRWMMPLAAAVILVMGVSLLWLFRENQETKRTLAEVQGQFDTSDRTKDERNAFIARATRPGTEVCALKPRLAEAPQKAHGTLYVMPDGEGWMLSAEGLRDVPDKTYQIWFMGEFEATSGGTFKTGDRAYVQEHDQMPPAGTKAVIITLEPEGGMEEPTGPEVLYGAADEMIRFL